MKGVCIIPNWQKNNTMSVVKKVSDFFRKAGVPVMILEEEEVLKKAEESRSEKGEAVFNPNSSDCFNLDIDPGWCQKTDMIIVAGGDGTILRVARDLAHWDVPILGINIGHKGFLAELEVSDIPAYLEKVLVGNYKLSNRIMLNATVIRGSEKVAKFTALNDMVVSKGPFSRIIRLDAFIGSTFLESYTGDGIIIATPTGSTGYSLSAGGPIVNPSLDLLVLTPVCPHSLYNRSVIVDGSESVTMTVYTRQSEIILTVDGQVGFTLHEDDKVVVAKARRMVSLVTFEDHSFYTLLGSKLKE